MSESLFGTRTTVVNLLSLSTSYWIAVPGFPLEDGDLYKDLQVSIDFLNAFLEKRGVPLSNPLFVNCTAFSSTNIIASHRIIQTHFEYVEKYDLYLYILQEDNLQNFIRDMDEYIEKNSFFKPFSI